MTIVMGQTPRYLWTGLSTDTKPTDNPRVGVNDLFQETDTGNQFIFNGTTWSTYTSSGTSQIVKSRVILVGDSLFGNGFVNAGVNTSAGGFVVDANGIATVDTSLAGANQINPGNYFHIYNASDANYTRSINGAVVAVRTTISSTSFTFDTNYNGSKMAAGDYSNDFGGQWTVSTMTAAFDTTWFNWFNWFNQSQFILVGSYAIGGVTTATPIKLISKILAGPKFDYFFYHAGTNDTASATTSANAVAPANTAIANIKTFCTAMINAGKIGFIGTTNPVANGVSSGTPLGRNSGNYMIAQGVLRFCAQNRGKLIPIDTFGDTVDGTSATGLPLANMVASGAADGVHLSSAGCIQVARYEAAAMSSILRIRTSPVTLLEDTQNFSQPGAPYLNILQNGLMSGVAGTVQAGYQAGSTMPSNWTANASPGGTVTTTGQFAKTVVAGSNEGSEGWALRAQMTGMANTNGPVFASSQFASLINANLGNWWQAGFWVYSENNTTALSVVCCQLYLNGNGSYQSVYSSQASALTNAFGWLAGDMYMITTNPVFIPATIDGVTATNITSAIMQIIVAFNGAGAATLQFSKAFVRIVDNPYA